MENKKADFVRENLKKQKLSTIPQVLRIMAYSLILSEYIYKYIYLC